MNAAGVSLDLISRNALLVMNCIWTWLCQKVRTATVILLELSILLYSMGLLNYPAQSFYDSAFTSSQICHIPLAMDAQYDWPKPHSIHVLLTVTGPVLAVSHVCISDWSIHWFLLPLSKMERLFKMPPCCLREQFKCSLPQVDFWGK